jgi:outer membrane lipoprotein-sorting protein
MLFVISASIFLASPVAEAEELTGRQVMEQVVARDEGLQVSRNLTMQLTDRRGKVRTRQTRGFRKYYGEDKRTVLFYLAPANIKDTGFLTYDYPDPEVDDDQWLYLPAVRKIRRISASDRGDYFLGTDFSFEDIKNESKPNLADYQHKRLGEEMVDGIQCIVVEGIPVSDEIANELGYSRVVSRIDPNTWMARRTEFWDTKGNRLKEIRSPKIEQIDGIWTSLEIHATNFKTGHETILTFSDVDYKTEVADRWFETNQLRRGL